MPRVPSTSRTVRLLEIEVVPFHRKYYHSSSFSSVLRMTGGRRRDAMRILSLRRKVVKLKKMHLAFKKRRTRLIRKLAVPYMSTVVAGEIIKYTCPSRPVSKRNSESSFSAKFSQEVLEDLAEMYRIEEEDLKMFLDRVVGSRNLTVHPSYQTLRGLIRVARKLYRNYPVIKSVTEDQFAIISRWKRFKKILWRNNREMYENAIEKQILGSV